MRLEKNRRFRLCHDKFAASFYIENTGLLLVFRILKKRILAMTDNPTKFRQIYHYLDGIHLLMHTDYVFPIKAN